MIVNQEKFDRLCPKETRAKEILVIAKEFQGQLNIENYSRPEKIHLQNVSKIESLTLKNLPQLKKLSIFNCDLKSIIIENCPKIKDLWLKELSRIKEVRFLDNLYSLEDLTVFSNNLSNPIKPFKGKIRSKHLSITSSRVPIKVIDLSNFEDLESFKLEDYSLSPGASRTSIEGTSECSDLKEIDIREVRLANLDFLDKLPCPWNLKAITIHDLGNIETTMLNLDIFSKFVNLEELNIEGRSFIGSLRILENLKKCNKITIRNTNVDRDLEYILALKLDGGYKVYGEVAQLASNISFLKVMNKFNACKNEKEQKLFLSIAKKYEEQIRKWEHNYSFSIISPASCLRKFNNVDYTISGEQWNIEAFNVELALVPILEREINTLIQQDRSLKEQIRIERGIIIEEMKKIEEVYNLLINSNGEKALGEVSSSKIKETRKELLFGSEASFEIERVIKILCVFGSLEKKEEEKARKQKYLKESAKQNKVLYLSSVITELKDSISKNKELIKMEREYHEDSLESQKEWMERKVKETNEKNTSNLNIDYEKVKSRVRNEFREKKTKGLKEQIKSFMKNYKKEDYSTNSHFDELKESAEFKALQVEQQISLIQQSVPSYPPANRQ